MNVDRIIAHVRENPGATTIEIARKLNAPCSVVGAALRMLRAEKRVRSAGNTKAMRYYVRP